MHNLKQIDIRSKKIFDHYIAMATDNSLPSELNFTNLFAWAVHYNYHYLVYQDFLWVMAIYNNKVSYLLPPIGSMSMLTSDKVSNFLKFIQPLIADSCITFKRMSEYYIQYFSNYLNHVDHTTFDDDYIYLSSDMADLKGYKFRKKRQQIEKFLNNHSVQVKNITLTDIDNCKSCLIETNQQIQSPGIEAETKAMFRILDHYSELGCEGVMINIENKVVAFSIGEKLDNETYVIHLEKGLRQHAGIYQIIFREYAKIIKDKYPYINREQDLGNLGLRQAKSSYFPVKKLEKFNVKIGLMNEFSN